MLALVIGDTILVLLLGAVVAGLLRSHADILRALRDLGAPLGDPSRSVPASAAVSKVGAASTTTSLYRTSPEGTLQMGTPLPTGRLSGGAHDLAGLTPLGDAVALAVIGVEHYSLLAFLTSGCSSCARFFEALAQPQETNLPADVRPVIVVKGPGLEQPALIASKAGAHVPVVMSNDAWRQYEVPGSPFFVLVDGRTGRRVGEGTANTFAQVVDLVRNARGDQRPGEASDGSDRDDPTRVDAELAAAGILPGDSRLYPRSLSDIEGRGRGTVTR